MLRRRSPLFSALLMLILCASVLVGFTYAQFTDQVVVSGNVITSGNLKASLDYWTKDDAGVGVWADAEKTKTPIFGYSYWEPGYTDVQYIKIGNTGKLAFQYALSIEPVQQSSGGINLMDVIDVYYGVLSPDQNMNDVPTDRAAFMDLAATSGLKKIGTLTQLNQMNSYTWGVVLPENSAANVTVPSGVPVFNKEAKACVVLHMQEEAGNEYMGQNAGGGFNLKLTATQYAYEEDAFGKDYDDIQMELFTPISLTIELPAGAVENGALLAEQIATDPNTGAAMTVPAGARIADGATKLVMTASTMSGTGSNVQLDEGEVMRSYDVHVDGLAADNTMPVQIKIPELMDKALNIGNYSLYHVENGATTPMTHVSTAAGAAHNSFTYDPATGDVTLCMATYSEVAVVSDTVNAWNGTVATGFNSGRGTEDDPYIIANADQLAHLGDRVSNDNANYGSKHYKLIANVDMGGDAVLDENGKLKFYPIGYTSEGYKGSFSGTFDGAGHTVSNIFQNTWMLLGTYSGTYYNAAMGLFGYVNGGTVKNLTIDNFYSEGEFAPTGCVTAYAAGNAKFENIAIINSHPQTYNTGVAGIVGWDNGGDTEAEASNFTFKNITVDSTNTVSALWGSWDVAAAGLLGYLGPESKVKLENCHVSATIDVYNDVCGNYQYYWYRYCGMLIGTVDKTKADGSLDLSNVTAKNCTVNFGDRHEYYYCEFVENTKASYTHDYQMSRVKPDDIIGSGDGATCQNHNHEEHGYETINGQSVLVEDKQAVYLPFYQLFGGYGWGVNGYDIGRLPNLDVEADKKGVDELKEEKYSEKFASKFTKDFLYRVGNGNAVSVGSLFEAKDPDATGIADIYDSGVHVTIDKVVENSNVSGVFTANTSDWTKGTIQFSGTGVVKLTIQDYNFCTPTVLYLEVVDAVNATGATSATKNNVVLLNDCGFSSLEVSGGYALYGNGFTMTCGSDSAALDMGYSFVTLNNGTLDNVQIVCPNFDYAALYKSNLTSGENRRETTNGTTRYYNAKSGVMASGNSQILNSRISGGRAAVNVSGGNVVIDNSRIELGAVASVLVGAANSLTLRDVTLIQKPTASTHDSNKTLMGFSVLYLCDSEGKATPTALEGSFVQQAWVNADDKQYVPSAGQDIVDGVMKETAFIHNINGKDSLNLGFAYMPEDAQKTVAAPDNITDNRTDKATIPYEMKDVKIQISILNTTVYVYSYKNTNGTADSFKTESEYVPNKYSDIITVSYSDTADGLTTGKSFGTDGWVYELNVDLDKLSGYALDFSKLSMSVNGVTVTDFKVDGNDKPTSPVAVTAGGTTYTLTATIGGKEYTATYKVTGTETSKESPSLVGTPSYGAGFGVANKYGGDWSAAAPVLDGITIKYWSVADSEYKEFALSSITFANTGKQNGTNNYWEYTHTNNDFTLKLTNTAVIHSSSGTYGMPVAGKDGKLYFTIASSGGFVSTGTSSRSITIAYEFTDNNGGDTLKFSHTWSISYSKDEQYNYSSFTSDGTLTKLDDSSSGGGGCVTPDTLITLEDGSKKEIQYVTYEDELLVWDFFKGEYTVAPSALIVNHGMNDYTVIELTFEDETTVKAITAHSFFDADENKFVLIKGENAEDYIGHHFVKNEGNEVKLVKLVDCKVYEDYTGSYSVVSAGHYNYMSEDMFSLTNVIHQMQEGLIVGENLKYDEEKLKVDIEKYGLYMYEEFADYVNEEQFNALCGPYVKISVEKGYITYDHLIEMLKRYVQ